MRETVMLVGHGRLPQGTAAKNLYDTLAIAVEIETNHSVILNADCTLVTQNARKFVAELLTGRCLDDGIEPLIHLLRARYQGGAQSALVAALKDLHRQFVSVQNSTKSTSESG